ncbi:serine hydrolase domain-containing protein [Longispora albida]|uniref:serine hydrolase domain-containing protein n=1 Tax=Longispora albida TaxID=203523 RepID=UPI00035EA22F|nr:serine hydrolase domain-containing protein [Longispora albida]
MKTIAVLAAGVTLAGSFALPATASAARPGCAPSPNSAALTAVLSDLRGEATGALARYTGSDGCFRGYGGVSSLESGRGIAEDSRFRAGSMTKLFTATATLQLAGQGKIDLGQTVQHYLPGLLPDSYEPVTIRHLLTYTGGISGADTPHKTPEWFFEHRYDHWEAGSQLDLTKPQLFTPGTQQKYGNADYIVLGLVIEKVTGRPWAHAIEHGIIKPLKLRDTYAPGEQTHIRGRHATGYELTADGYREVTTANPSLQWSAASLITSAPDLETFIRALLGGKLLQPAQQAELTRVPDVPVYGSQQKATHAAGITRIELAPGYVLWGKSGDRPGYNNGVAMTPEGATLVYSVNTAKMGTDRPALADRIVQATLRKQ